MSNADYERLQRIVKFTEVTKMTNIGYSEEDARDILNALANVLEEEGSQLVMPDTAGVNVRQLRAIANAEADPLDALSDEDRLGYVLMRGSIGERFASATYSRTNAQDISSIRRWNTLAATVVAEAERQKGSR